MAEFLKTEGVADSLSRIIEKANKKAILISPYVSINTRLAQLIRHKLESGTEIHMIYRESAQSTEAEEWLESMPNIRASCCDILHAKCYLNETEVLVTSMNLYEYSQVNNLEMGILVSRRRDLSLYRDIEKHVEYIESVSKPIREPEPDSTPNQTSVLGSLVSGIRGFGRRQQPEQTQPTEPARAHEPTAPITQATQPSQQSPDAVVEIGVRVHAITQPAQQPQTVYMESPQRQPEPIAAASISAPNRSRKNRIQAPKSGFCIRCGVEIPADPMKPYCKTHFRSWNRYKNNDYQEKVCHTCGDEHSTNMAKPVCLTCYRKYRSVLKFAAT